MSEEASTPTEETRPPRQPWPRKTKEQPHYRLTHEQPNRKARREAVAQQQREIRSFETWKRALTIAGVDFETVVRNRIAAFRKEHGLAPLEQDAPNEQPDTATVPNPDDDERGDEGV